MSFTLKNLKDLVIVEGDIDKCKNTKKKFNCVTFENENELCVDTKLLYNKILKLNGKEKVKVLVIDWSSTQKNMEIVKLFPNIKRLILYGKELSSFSGLENLKEIEEIIIDTDTNKKRKINGIENTVAKILSVKIANKRDLDTISKCKFVRSLVLKGSFDLEFELFRDMQLSHLYLRGGKYHTITNLKSIKRLKNLEVSGCTKLVGFGDNNDSIERLTVVSCNKLELSTISQIKGLKHLSIRDQRCVDNINFINQMPRLKRLTICLIKKIGIDDFSPITNSTTLEELFLDINIKKLKDIAGLNKKLLVGSWEACYDRGELVKNKKITVCNFKLEF